MPDKKFLLVRTDKIGDLLLTLPALASLKRAYPDCFIGFLASHYAAPILTHHPAINVIFKMDEPETPFLSLADSVRKYDFETSIHFYSEFPSAFLTHLVGIPRRIGPWSKLASLLFTERIQQNRSKVEKHEADYNLDLVRAVGADGQKTNPAIYLTQDEIEKGKEILKSKLRDFNAKPIFLHPGSKGSAESWPIESFLKLSQMIAEHLGEVVITGGRGEEKILERFKALGNSNIHIIQPGSLCLRELACVISQGRLMISNSTGPLHMAVALNIPTVSFYPHQPMVTSAQRWGPFPIDKIHTVLTPATETAPLQSIEPETAFKKAKELAG